MCTAGLWGVARGSSALLRRTCGPYGVDDLTQFSPACGHLGLVVRGRALDGEALLFGLALLTQGLLLSLIHISLAAEEPSPQADKELL